MACGTPAIAFDIGGNQDLIKHGETGYLCKPFDTLALARCIDESFLPKNKKGVRKCSKIH